MFSIIRLEGYLNFFIGIFLQVLYLPSITVVKTEDPEDFEVFFLMLQFQSFGTMTHFLFKSPVGNET